MENEAALVQNLACDAVGQAVAVENKGGLGGGVSAGAQVDLRPTQAGLEHAFFHEQGIGQAFNPPQGIVAQRQACAGRGAGKGSQRQAARRIVAEAFAAAIGQAAQAESVHAVELPILDARGRGLEAGLLPAAGILGMPGSILAVLKTRHRCGIRRGVWAAPGGSDLSFDVQVVTGHRRAHLASGDLAPGVDFGGDMSPGRLGEAQDIAGCVSLDFGEQGAGLPAVVAPLLNADGVAETVVGDVCALAPRVDDGRGQAKAHAPRGVFKLHSTAVRLPSGNPATRFVVFEARDTARGILSFDQSLSGVGIEILTGRHFGIAIGEAVACRLIADRKQSTGLVAGHQQA